MAKSCVLLQRRLASGESKGDWQGRGGGQGQGYESLFKGTPYVSEYHESNVVALLFHTSAGSGIVLRVLSFEQGIVSLLNQF